jgi:curved DNA-binding protein CbpA
MTTASDIDPYALLGVAPTATAAEIQRAYRRKALLCHPDRGGTHSQMHRLNRAYALLTDPAARRDYDLQHRANRPSPAPSPPPPNRPRQAARPAPNPPPRSRGQTAPVEDTFLISTAGAVARRLAFWTGRAVGKVAKLFH